MKTISGAIAGAVDANFRRNSAGWGQLVMGYLAKRQKQNTTGSAIEIQSSLDQFICQGADFAMLLKYRRTGLYNIG